MHSLRILTNCYCLTPPAGAPSTFDATLPTPWSCLRHDWNKKWAPLRRNRERDIECLSEDSANCMWTDDQASCKSRLAACNLPAARPLTCGDAHKKVYGVLGYEQTFHWCYMGNRILPDSCPSPGELLNAYLCGCISSILERS